MLSDSMCIFGGIMLKLSCKQIAWILHECYLRFLSAWLFQLHRFQVARNVNTALMKTQLFLATKNEQTLNRNICAGLLQSTCPQSAVNHLHGLFQKFLASCIKKHNITTVAGFVFLHNLCELNCTYSTASTASVWAYSSLLKDLILPLETTQWCQCHFSVLSSMGTNGKSE